jgi:hypothetical protein
MQIDRFIVEWNTRFPIDYWWRKKYNVPFGSKKHRNTSHLDMFIDFRESKIIREAIKSLENKKDQDDLQLLGVNPESGRKVQKMTQREIDKDFAELDIDQFYKSKDLL